MLSSARILTEWNCLSCCEFFIAIFKLAIRVSLPNQPAIHRAIFRSNNCFHPIDRPLQTLLNRMTVSRPWYAKTYQKTPTLKLTGPTNTSCSPIIQCANLKCRRLPLGKPQWMENIYMKVHSRPGGPSGVIPITISSKITSITSGNYFIVAKTSNRLLDLSKPTIPCNKSIATSIKADSRFPSPLLVPADGQCTFTSTRWITSYQNGESLYLHTKQLEVFQFSRPGRMSMVPPSPKLIQWPHGVWTNPVCRCRL